MICAWACSESGTEQSNHTMSLCTISPLQLGIGVSALDPAKGRRIHPVA